MDFLRHLEGRERFPAFGRNLVGIKLCARPEHDDGDRPFAPLRVGKADDGAFGDVGELVDDALDLARGDVLAARDDHVLLAVGDEQEAVLVEIADVAGAEPVAEEALLGLLRIVPIAARDLRSAQADFAFGPGRQYVAVVVADLDLDMGERTPRRAELVDLHARLHQGVARACLGEPEAVDEAGIGKERGEFADAVLGRLLAAGDAPLEGREVVFSPVRTGEEPRHHDRSEPGAGDLLLLDVGKHRLLVELAVKHDAAADPPDGDAGQVEGADMVERADGEEPVPGRHLQRDDVVHALPVEVLVGVHDALGAVRRAGGVHQAEEIARLAHDERCGWQGIAAEDAAVLLRRLGEEHDIADAPDGSGEFLVCDQKLGPGVAGDEAAFLARETEVDRQEDRSDMADGKRDLVEGRAVLHEDGDDVVLPDAVGGEIAGHLLDAVVELRIGDALPLIDQRQPVRIAHRVEANECAQIDHGCPPPFGPASVRSFHSELVLCDVVEDHFLGDRREAEQAAVAPQPLDVELARIAHAAHRLHRPFGGRRAGLGGDQLGDVGLAAERFAGVEQRRRMAVHQPRAFHLRMGLGERELQPLIGRDRRVPEHPALVGVVDGEAKREFDRADQARRRYDALGVEHVEKLVPAAMQRADHLVALDADIVEEDGRRRLGVGAELLDRAVGDALAVGVDEEQRDAVGAALRLLVFERAGDDQRLVARLDIGDPDLLPGQPEAVAVGDGMGAHFQRVGAGIGFRQGHTEADVAGNEAGQQRLAHRLGAVAADGHPAEDRVAHEQLADRGAGAGRCQRLDDQRHVEHAAPRAAIFLRQRDAAQAGLADRLPRLAREFLLPVLLAPVVEPVGLADAARGLDHQGLFFGQIKLHL